MNVKIRAETNTQFCYSNANFHAVCTCTCFISAHTQTINE